MQGGDNGAETITVNDPGNKDIYMVFVHDYSPNPSYPMTSSGAQVAIYEESSITLAVPTTGTDSDIYWLVGCFKGDDMLGTFIEINELLQNNNPLNNPTLCTDLFP